MRDFINLISNLYENADIDREFYINQSNEFRAERDKWWPVSKELMDSYRDGSHTEKWHSDLLIWVKNGLLHRDGDKPAEIYANGSLAWYKNDLVHREGDKPADINSDGDLLWSKNGYWHRDGDKPARIEATGSLQWCKNGELHRVRGPAVITENNNFEWYFKGEKILVKSQEEFLKWLSDKGHIDVYRLRKQ